MDPGDIDTGNRIQDTDIHYAMFQLKHCFSFAAVKSKDADAGFACILRQPDKELSLIWLGVSV